MATWQKKQERISEISAITYHLNEKTGELDSSVMSNENVVQTNVREYLDEVTFALPNVQVNSIIEIAYTVESPFISRLDDWYFQKNYPVKKSWYTVSVYGPYRYAFALQGQKQLKNAKTNDENGLTALGRLRERHDEWWVAEDIPAYVKEPYTTTREDYVAKLSFQMESAGSGKEEKTFLKSWTDVTNDLQESRRFKQFYTGTRDFLSFGIPEGVPSMGKARYIYNDFKSTFKWDGNYGVYPNVTFKELMSKKKGGNTSSLGLALFQTLLQGGYEAEAVLLSPKFNGRINYNYPFVDHLIATVVRLTIGGKTYLLDPIHDVPFGQLGSEFLNGNGLILGDVPAWQNLTIAAEDYKTSEATISIAEDLINVDMKLTMKKYGVISSEVDPKDLFKSDWEITDINIEKNESEVQELTANIENEVEDDLFIVPLSFDKIVFSENPFNASERLYPIDFLYKKKYSYKLEVKLSEEYVFDAIPESKIVKTTDGKLSAILNVNQLGQNLNLTFLFWTKTNSFDVVYYPHLQAAYQLMAELGEGSIIVRRKY